MVNRAKHGDVVVSRKRSKPNPNSKRQIRKRYALIAARKRPKKFEIDTWRVRDELIIYQLSVVDFDLDDMEINAFRHFAEM